MNCNNFDDHHQVKCLSSTLVYDQIHAKLMTIPLALISGIFNLGEKFSQKMLISFYMKFRLLNSINTRYLCRFSNRGSFVCLSQLMLPCFHIYLFCVVEEWHACANKVNINVNGIAKINAQLHIHELKWKHYSLKLVCWLNVFHSTSLKLKSHHKSALTLSWIVAFTSMSLHIKS